VRQKKKEIWWLDKFSKRFMSGIPEKPTGERCDEKGA
jgi:hypothetical protein